jgi:hypothetical protein
VGANRDLEDYDDVAWASLLAKPELVFARASPQDKLTIVSMKRTRALRDALNAALVSGFVLTPKSMLQC